VLLQDRADDLALDTFAAPVYDPDFINTCTPALLEIFPHHIRNVLWRKGVKIDRVLNGNDDGLVEGRIVPWLTGGFF
jgi:hypothetical protein